ncbi:MAG TPA: type II toxin-antitoxin system antitoxin SocA domain-containing protein [Nostocaceae cyanobacterium]|nr:type II toxin-antitoxin system antitoxin SocA domain-containing protein [Nostocaceae cyanobacterium]
MAITTANQIADYFIWLANESGSFVSNLKLQKLVYYAQAWYLALYDGQPLFDEDFEAWIHGPVIPALYQEYKSFSWKPILKEVEKPKFTQEVNDFLEELTEVYFGYDGFELEKMTHREDPWINARGDIPADEPSNAIIPKEAMREYYQERAETEED